MTKYLLWVLYNLSTNPNYTSMSNHGESKLQLKVQVSRPIPNVQIETKSIVTYFYNAWGGLFVWV